MTANDFLEKLADRGFTFKEIGEVTYISITNTRYIVVIDKGDNTIRMVLRDFETIYDLTLEEILKEIIAGGVI